MISTSPVTETSELVTPYGGELVDLLADEEERQELKDDLCSVG